MQCSNSNQSGRGCVTPAQIANWQEATADGEGGYDTELIDGFDEVPEDAQNKIILALNDGHVADEDWKGVSLINLY